MANYINLSEILHKRPEVAPPTIYAYTLPESPSHDGYIKIGHTVRNLKIRLNEQLRTAAMKEKILLKESAMRDDGTCFRDKDVHRILKRRGFTTLRGENNEWYNCKVEDIKSAINELRSGKRYDGQRTENFKMRNEQKDAVEITQKYFERAKTEYPDRTPKFLWNAKMRFGKTFAAYQLAKNMNLKKILVLTFKPAVESAWKDDLRCHIDFEGWQLVSNKEAKFDEMTLDGQYEACDKSKPIVVFGSFQDLLQTNNAGGIKAKNEFIHATNWDIVIFDEYHFGAWRENARNLFEKFDEENTDFDFEKYQREEADNAINETFLPITADYFLFLSGTPFRALNSGEFIEDQIYNWTYADEQRAKKNWRGDGENPYAAMPTMVMLTYKMHESITVNAAINEGYDEFDINEFFRAEQTVKGKVKSSQFLHKDDVQKWLKMIQGKYMPVDGIKLGGERPPMPFSDVTLLSVLSHTLWFLPNVASCYAMSDLLRSPQNTFFNDYKIIVCAGPDAGIGLDALPPVRNAMKNPLETKTITLSCGKLTTGVTVRPWTGVFMLRNLKSPETYFQTAFRVQSPWEAEDDLGNKKIIKEECYIFDFALERALRQISDYSCFLDVSANRTQEEKVAEFINFLPILAFDGSSMNKIDAKDILDITYAGTSATLLAKRWQTALLIHVDNDTLKKLQDNKEALDALMRIEGFRSLNTEIQTIINRSEKVKRLKKEKGDELTSNERKRLTEDEKKTKSLRKQVQENLLKLAARIPAFMYLTDYREQTLRDVITQIEPELFRKVTGLTVKDFETLCGIGLFDSERMNQGVFGFRKYEDRSLSYTGIDKHKGESVGGWDTVLRRKEYEILYGEQQAAMTDFKSIIIPERHNVVAVSGDETAGIVSSVAEEKKNGKAEEISEKTEKVKVGIVVTHKKFGDGTVISVDKARKYIRIKFSAGEKLFIFPDSFVSGFLDLK